MSGSNIYALSRNYTLQPFQCDYNDEVSVSGTTDNFNTSRAVSTCQPTLENNNHQWQEDYKISIKQKRQQCGSMATALASVYHTLLINIITQ